MADIKITIEELTKQYDQFYALKNVNLEIERGMFGLLGPNGAGKTTLMRIMATLMKPSSGIIKVNGVDLQKNRKMVRTMLGFLPQDFRFFQKLSTWDFLDYGARLAGIKDAKVRQKAVGEMLEKVGLFKYRDRLANRLSGGMKRRLGIAQALIGDPQILIVDEPTTGLDPEERIRFRNILSEMSHKDIIIILSTHIVSDISSTCHQIALINRGEVAFSGSPEALIGITRGHVFQMEVDDMQLDLIKDKYPVIATVPSENGWDIQIVADSLNGFQGTEIEPNLEHAYMYFMEYQAADQY